MIAAALVEVRRRLSQRAEAPSGLPDLEHRERQLQGEIGRLGEALLTTDQPLATVTQMLSEREAQLREINARVAAYKTAPNVAEMKTMRFENEAKARATDLLGMMRRSPAEARKALEKVLTGPLMFTPIDTPEGRRFQVTGQAGLGSVFGISITGVPKGIRTGTRSPPRRLNLTFQANATRHRAPPRTPAHPFRWGWARLWPRSTPSRPPLPRRSSGPPVTALGMPPRRSSTSCAPAAPPVPASSTSGMSEPSGGARDDQRRRRYLATHDR